MEKESFRFLALAMKRKTTYEYAKKGVGEYDLLQILETGRWAP